MVLARKFIAACCVLCAAVSFASAQAPVSSTPLLSGAPDGVAPLVLGRNISCSPLGFAYLDGRKEADIFIFAPSGLDIGLWRCESDGNFEGHPVYRKEQKCFTPWGKKPGNAIVFQDGDDILMLRMSRTKLTVAKWDGNGTFVEFFVQNVDGLPNSVTSFSVIRRDKKQLEIACLLSDGQTYRPEELNYNTASLYDGAGSYRGNFPKCGLYRFFVDNNWTPLGYAEKVSVGMDILISPRSVSIVEDFGYVVTNNLGSMKFLPYSNKTVKGGVPADHLRKADGSVWVFRCHGADAISIPDNEGKRTSLLIGGECALYTHEMLSARKGETPRFGESVTVLEHNAPLYGGSLTVPNVVDWDGDGVLDIVAGNSEGRLLFFKNGGSNQVPAFGLPRELCSDGDPICLRPGYYVTQGPMEGAWGYLAPTVFDWNGDGLPDVITSGSRAKYELFLNVGTATEPALGKPFTLHCDAMELHGVWRVRPAIGRIGSDIYMMIQDDQNALHLYRRVDDSNVEDCGKVLLENGDIITGHNGDTKEKLGMGQWGRAKMRFCDWDGDGDLDLLLGCIKRASFPAPQIGLPYRRFKEKKVGLQVLYFENVGGKDAASMRFAQPKQLTINGKDFPLGAHSNAPEPCMLGDTSDGFNLIVGCESGKYFFFNRKDITYAE